MSNFRVIAAELIGAGAALEVTDAAALPREATRLLTDRSRREEMSAAAGRWHRANAGAVDRTLTVVREVLATSASN
jgi:3-deoxy-D-manno-octulosonic-acid transferase